MCTGVFVAVRVGGFFRLYSKSLEPILDGVFLAVLGVATLLGVFKKEVVKYVEGWRLLCASLNEIVCASDCVCTCHI